MIFFKEMEIMRNRKKLKTWQNYYRRPKVAGSNTPNLLSMMDLEQGEKQPIQVLRASIILHLIKLLTLPFGLGN